MPTPEPSVRFYDLSGPKPWSPACWCTRFALNYKGIPYTTVKLSYPAIKPKCEELFTDMTGLDATVPIIEILGPNYKALNDSTPIAHLLNERFTEEMGYKHLRDVGFEHPSMAGQGIYPWIVNDVYENCLDPSDGSKEFFKRTREEDMECELKDVMEVLGKGEETLLNLIRERFSRLRERLKNDDGSNEPTYWDFYEAAKLKWVQAASPEKYEKLLRLYGDNTFTKLLKKVEKYSYDG
ncbi:hypothetical protein F5884DRAFT_847958 [Xylogone sp. PMI_703]|nr:hypothetical protein F5884DRAFT_847958 [Xylogone sp. PMI_703]